MTITAKVIADSVSPEGIRLTTMQWRYPKFIHGECLTHRVFSRNASSSRAIPVRRMIQDVIDDPAMPVFWGKNQAGMQAKEELSESEKEHAIANWLGARSEAVGWAQRLHSMGAHKQIVNRIIEPWCHINTLVTSTEWANFDALRCHPDAQPEMRALAEASREARLNSTPTRLRPGEWHLPYITDDDRQQAYWDTRHVGYGNSECFDEEEALQTCIKMSVARCARVSYLTHEGKPTTIEEDVALYDRLVGSTPLHASPTEHQAAPDRRLEAYEDLAITPNGYSTWENPTQHGNFVGWRQYRKMLPGEYMADR